MIRGFILLTGLLAFISLNTDAQNRLTLEQAIETGMQNNIDVLQSGLAVEKSSVIWRQSKMSALPNLNASINQGTNFGKSIDPFTNTFIDQKVNYGNYGASSNVLLFNGFSLHNEIRSNKLGLEASEMEWQQAKDNLTINIILAYLQVLSARDVLRQAEDQVSVTKSQVDRLKLLQDEGAISPSVFYDLKGQFAGEQVNIADARANMESAKLTLTQLLNIPYQKDMEVVSLPQKEISMQGFSSPDDIYKIAESNFAEVRASDLRTQSAERNIQSVKGKLYPTLAFGGSMSTNFSSVATINELVNSTIVASTDYVDVGGNKYPVYKTQNNYNSHKLKFGNQLNNNMFYTLNLGLSVPLFNGSYVRSQIKVAEINYRSARLNEQKTKTQLQQAIERSWINLVSSYDKYNLLNEQVKSFDESFRIAEVKFNEGVLTSVDYLVAKNNLDRAKSNLIISRYDFILREKILNFYAGK